MTWYLIVCLIIIVLLTLAGGPMGFIAAIPTCLLLGVAWFVVTLVVSSDDCKSYEGGISDTYYEECP